MTATSEAAGEDRPEPAEGHEFARLIEEARGGSLAAQGRLLEAFRSDLLAIAASNLDSGIRPKVSASDLVQESLLEAHRDFGAFRGNTVREARSWLKRILLHNLVNHFRHWNTSSRQFRREVPFESVSEHALRSPQGDSELTASDLASARELQSRLDDELARLSADHKQVLELRHRERLTFEEIGGRLGRSSDAARMLWYRAFDELSRRLQ